MRSTFAVLVLLAGCSAAPDTAPPIEWFLGGDDKTIVAVGIRNGTIERGALVYPTTRPPSNVWRWGKVVADGESAVLFECAYGVPGKALPIDWRFSIEKWVMGVPICVLQRTSKRSEPRVVFKGMLGPISTGRSEEWLMP